VALNDLAGPTPRKRIAKKVRASRQRIAGHARKYVDSANMQIVVVGDPHQIEPSRLFLENRCLRRSK